MLKSEEYSITILAPAGGACEYAGCAKRESTHGVVVRNDHDVAVVDLKNLCCAHTLQVVTLALIYGASEVWDNVFYSWG